MEYRSDIWLSFKMSIVKILIKNVPISIWKKSESFVRFHSADALTLQCYTCASLSINPLLIHYFFFFTSEAITFISQKWHEIPLYILISISFYQKSIYIAARLLNYIFLKWLRKICILIQFVWRTVILLVFHNVKSFIFIFMLYSFMLYLFKYL